MKLIMLTATSAPIDRVVKIELGADDHIRTPWTLRELLARIRRLMRREANAVAPPQLTSPNVCIGAQVLHPDRRVLRRHHGQEAC